MAGSIPQDFIRDIVDTTDIVSLLIPIYLLKEKVKITGDSALFVMMVKIHLLVSASKSSFIFASNVERVAM